MEFTFDEMMAEVREMTMQELIQSRFKLHTKKIRDGYENDAVQYLDCIDIEMAKRKVRNESL